MPLSLPSDTPETTTLERSGYTPEYIHGLTSNEWIEFGEKVLNQLQTSSFPLVEHLRSGKTLEIDKDNILKRISHPPIWETMIDRIDIFSGPYLTCKWGGKMITLHPISGQIPENLKGHPFFVWLWRMRDRELSGDMHEILYSIKAQHTQSITQAVKDKTKDITTP